jgi:hypothetical protein
VALIPKDAPIIQLVTPGCWMAVDRAIHDVDTDRFHQRISGACPLCLTMGEKLARAFRDNVPGSDIARQAKERIAALMDAQDDADRQGSEGS